ncbi:hypothetical protein BTM25_17170 [Actinomadura rubteroloni]|uniref:Uncharacterized protein n=1 Tax=Actinomadura rubteroloni TaxID=1926885 RepID=A0A2P4UQI3_9ACTN|nr:hypothetical protein [Actinomadura rubteroloni]POM27305.1 hypothetical protein BTM25_17170 [Actinomadura rubteroloni]
MSSAVLYLAIVAVWAVVLVPMWLRRDNNESPGVSRFLPRRIEETDEFDLDETPVTSETEDDADIHEPSPVPQPRRRHGRAAVIARRRRRTTGLTLLFLTTVVLGATGVAPWWTTVPALLLFTGHLALLRVAVGVDAARRADLAQRARFRRAAEQEAEAAAVAAAHAEVIELVPVPEEEVFDQYADDRRAVGE